MTLPPAPDYQPNARKDETGMALPPFLADLSELIATLIVLMSLFGGLGPVSALPRPISVLAIGVCFSCALFRIILRRTGWHPRIVLKASPPTLLGCVVAAFIALTSGQGEAITESPIPLEPVQELPGRVIEGTLASDGRVAYAFDGKRRLVQYERRSDVWTVRYLRKRPLREPTALEICGESLVVAFDTGWVARLSRADGRVEEQRPIAGDDVLIACSGEWIFAARGETGRILRLWMPTLESYSDWVDTDMPISALVADRDRVLVVSRSEDEIGVLDDLDGTLTPEAISWRDKVTAPNAALPMRRYVFVSHAGLGCVTRLDENGRELMPARPTGGGPTQLIPDGDDVYALSEDSAALTRVTEKRADRVGEHVKVGTLVVDAVSARGDLLVAERGGKAALRVFTFEAIRAAEPDGKFALNADCR
jgi:hypothetical protein